MNLRYQNTIAVSGPSALLDPLTLSEFMQPLVAAVKAAATSQWVAAELAEVSGGHHLYLTLIEHDAEHKKVAEMRASIWAAGKDKLLRRFEAGTGGEKLRKGLKVLLKLRPSLSPLYGFAATVEDIDPAYTLGDAARKLAELRQRLQTENLYDAQKQRFAPPGDFTSVAVICPAGAAGLGDFQSHADPLQEAGLCDFEYFTATFQGERTSSEIVAALREVFRQQRENKYDAVIILRGGGSQADLAWLNDYEISSAIAKMSLPVMVAIGHERDSVILDEIACVSFHTPSKAISHVAGTIVSNAREAIGNVESIVAATNKALALAQGRIDSVLGTVKHFAESDWESAAQAITAAKATVIDQARGACGLVAVSLENERTRVRDSAVRNQERATTGIDAWREAVRRDSARLHGAAESQMAAAVSVVRGHATRGLTVAEQLVTGWCGLIRDRTLLARDQTAQRVESLGQLVNDNTRRQVAVVEAEIERHRLLTRDRALLGVQTTRENLKALGEYVIGLGPKKTLERGFVMTKRRGSGKAITRKAQVKPGDVLEVDFADGNVDAVVQ